MAYSRDRRWLYSAFAQLSGITYDRGSLAKDDRADAIAMMVATLNGHLVEDEKVVAERESEKMARAFIENPLDWAQSKVSKGLRGVAARLQNRGRGKQHRGRR
ncbi:putative DNA maturase B [Klebsiella phage KA]|nr:putative DNA maturase B [Klebsiella phage KA]